MEYHICGLYFEIDIDKMKDPKQKVSRVEKHQC